MSVSLRLSVIGKRGQPIYRIIAMEKRSKRNGKYIENLGYYDPNVKPPKLEINKQKLEEWKKNGAQVSTGLQKLLK